VVPASVTYFVFLSQLPFMSDELHPLQIAAWRKMSFAEKMALLSQFQQMAREAIRRRLARQHPEWSAETLTKEVARSMIHLHT
jgi:hypothetical protein